MSSTTFSGTNTEAIAERSTITINGSFSNLSNFGSIYFNKSYANGISFDAYSPFGVRYGMHMIDSANLDMADPGPTGSDGTFTDTQHRCN